MKYSINQCVLFFITLFVFTFSVFATPLSLNNSQQQLNLLKAEELQRVQYLQHLTAVKLKPKALKAAINVNTFNNMQLKRHLTNANDLVLRLKASQKQLKNNVDGLAYQLIKNKKNAFTLVILELNKAYAIVEILKKNIALTDKIKLRLLAQEKSQRLVDEQRVYTVKVHRLENNIQRIEKEINRLYKKNLLLIEQKNLRKSEDFNASFQCQSYLLGVLRQLGELNIELLEFRIRLQNSSLVVFRHNSVLELNKASNELSLLLERINENRVRLLNLQPQLKAQSLLWGSWVKHGLLNLSEQTRYKETLNIAVSKLKYLLSLSKGLTENVAKKNDLIGQYRSVLVAKRQGVSVTNLNNLLQLGGEFLSMPITFGHYIMALSSRVLELVYGLSWIKQAFFISLLVLLMASYFFGRRLLQQVELQENRERLSGNLVDISLLLVRRNWGGVCLFLSMLCVFNFVGLSSPSYHLVLLLFFVWFLFRLMGGIARLSLLDRISDVSGQDVALYYKLRLSFILGGGVTLGTVLAYQLTLPYLLQVLFNHLFMFFLMLVSIVLLRARDLVPRLLHPYLKTKRPYVKRVIRLLCVLIPSLILFNAIVGLLGYVNLTWVMSYYQLYFILLVSAYVLLRGILSDFTEVVSDWVIRKIRNGWVWSEALLKPIDRILRLGLFCLFIVSLFFAFGWHHDVMLLDKLKALYESHIIDFSLVKISVKSLIEFSVLLAFFLWLIRWTREFCYRFLYRQIRDAGLRNSLSLFTQYTIITLGAVITLRVLGIDFTGMSYVLGGLAVGMGFGLRDFASNIIGGLMLLIERPVREGDLISIDNFEGRVTHMGLRAMTVKSWDHLEVVIPNAETFNKPFTNWTHQDSVVRTVVPIKVDRRDSAVKIQQLIFDVIDIIPEVLAEPAPQVFLKQIDEALIEFEVRYFINIEQYSRVAIRSIVLFAITAQFKAAGVKPPIPPIKIQRLTDGSKT